MLHHCIRSYHYSCYIECFVSTVIYTYFSSCMQSRLARAIRWGLKLTFQIIKVVYPPQKTFCPLTPLPNTLPLHPTFKLLQPLFQPSPPDQSPASLFRPRSNSLRPKIFPLPREWSSISRNRVVDILEPWLLQQLCAGELECEMAIFGLSERLLLVHEVSLAATPFNV